MLTPDDLQIVQQLIEMAISNTVKALHDEAILHINFHEQLAKNLATQATRVMGIRERMEKIEEKQLSQDAVKT